MRILWLCPYLPLPLSGAGNRVFNLIKALAASAEIDLIATSAPWDERHVMADQLRLWCRTLQVIPLVAPTSKQRRTLQARSLLSRRPAQYWTIYSAEMQDQINHAQRHVEYDLAIVEHSFTGYYHISRNVPIVIDQHNVESEILFRTSQLDRSNARRAFSLVEYWKYRLDEQRVCRKADLILAVSERDRETMQTWAQNADCHLIPNGVDVVQFSPGMNANVREIPGNIVFTGPLHYPPNADAVMYFGREIFPLVRRQIPHATLTIVGANPPREIEQLGQLSGVSLEGFVPDVRPYLERAQVVVAPLRVGGGTRLKILEAFAMNKAVVATSLGCEGLAVHDQQELVVADDPAQFASRVIDLLTDSVHREVLAQQARRLVEERYDWGSVGVSLERTLRWFLQHRKK